MTTLKENALLSFLNEHFKYFTGPEYFVNSQDYLNWALMLPYANDNLQTIIKRDDQIIVTATCYEIVLHGVKDRLVAGNFLCIHKDYRKNGLTKSVVFDSYRKIFENGIRGVIWLSEKKIYANCICGFNYYVKNINDYHNNSDLTYQLAGISDIPTITKSINKEKYLSPIFNDNCVYHYFFEYPNVVRSLLIGSSFCSYYVKETNFGIKSAYIFYYSKLTKLIMECCIKDALTQGISLLLISNINAERRMVISELDFVKTDLDCYYYTNLPLQPSIEIELVLV